MTNLKMTQMSTINPFEKKKVINAKEKNDFWTYDLLFYIDSPFMQKWEFQGLGFAFEKWQPFKLTKEERRKQRTKRTKAKQKTIISILYKKRIRNFESSHILYKKKI